MAGGSAPGCAEGAIDMNHLSRTRPAGRIRGCTPKSTPNLEVSMVGHDTLRARGRAARALTACALSLFLASPGADACPPATPADYAMYPSTLRTIQPEPLLAAGTPPACPGATNPSPCGGHQVYVPSLNPLNPELRQNQLYLFLPGTQ